MSAFDRGRINYYLENYETAQLDLEEAKNAAPGDSGVYLYLGMAYEATGDYNYAITNVYTAYLTQKDGTAELYNQLGLCYLKQEQYAPALDAFQKAMQRPFPSMKSWHTNTWEITTRQPHFCRIIWLFTRMTRPQRGNTAFCPPVSR